MPRLLSGVGKSVSVQQATWSYYAFAIEGSMTSWSLTFTGGSGDPNVYVTRNGIPTLASYDMKDDSTSSSGTLSKTSPANGVYVVGVNVDPLTSSHLGELGPALCPYPHTLILDA